MDKKSFIIYQNWARLIINLDDVSAGILIKAICNHVKGESVKIDDEKIKAIYSMIEEKLDEDADKYAEVVKKRKDAGKKGLKSRWQGIANDSKCIANDSKCHNLLGDTDTDTDTVTDTVTDKYKSIRQDKPARHAHGEYKHVRLSDKEYQKLIEDYGSTETTDAIKYLDEYIEMKGVKYKNHNLVLRKWVFDAVREHKPKEQGEDFLLRVIRGEA